MFHFGNRFSLVKAKDRNDVFAFATRSGEALLRRQGNKLLPADRRIKLRCHSDQVGKRFSLHLRHYLAALDLHGDFAGPEFKRDLRQFHPAHGA
jgi:hypothetical protein